MTNRILFLVAIVFSLTASAQTKNEQYYLQSAPFKMPVVVEPTFPDKTFSIKNFGAVGDGQNMNTAAVVKAIDAC